MVKNHFAGGHAYLNHNRETIPILVWLIQSSSTGSMFEFYKSNRAYFSWADGKDMSLAGWLISYMIVYEGVYIQLEVEQKSLRQLRSSNGIAVIYRLSLSRY